MSRETAIVTNHVERVYASQSGAVHALRDINLEIKRGQFVALKGRSGSGKTTLLNCIGGLDNPTGGTIEIFGQSLGTMSDKKRTTWRRTQVGFIFQQMGLLPGFSTYENLDVMARLGAVPRRQRRRKIVESLDQVGLLHWIDHRPYEMSGGQQQRVAIARALVTSPNLILADEPTSELDSETTHDILGVFQENVKKHGMTILLSSHDPIVDEYADTILYLSDGQIDS